MNYSTALFCIICLFFTFNSTAQHLIKFENGYLLDSVEFTNDNEILNILSFSPRAKKAFLRSKWEKKRANQFGVISIICIVSSPLLLSQYPNPNADSPNVNFLFYGLGTGVVGVLTGMMGINYLYNSKKSSNKNVINYYNEDIIGSRYNAHDYVWGNC